MDRRHFLRLGGIAASAPLISFPSSFDHGTECVTGGVSYIDGMLNLGSNENPYGPSPMATEAMRKAVSEGNRYVQTNDLREKIASQKGIAAENVIIGAGSSEILGLTALMGYKASINTLLTSHPTFFILPTMYERLGGKVIRVPLNSDKKYDLERMGSAITADTKMVYICNPNNPTGTKLFPSLLRAFVEDLSRQYIVVIDEVYHDYITDPSLIPMAATNKNIIVVRSFSKVYGLAGMRIGYGVSHPDTIAELLKYMSREGNAMTQVGKAAALASLDDAEFIKMTLDKNEASKKILYDFLSKSNIDYIYSNANCSYFSLDKFPKNFIEMVEAKNVIVRQVDDNGKQYCRVSTGKPEDMTTFTSILSSMLK
jgi:histidinol-phosphate aminotransferase